MGKGRGERGERERRRGEGERKGTGETFRKFLDPPLVIVSR